MWWQPIDSYQLGSLDPIWLGALGYNILCACLGIYWYTSNLYWFILNGLWVEALSNTIEWNGIVGSDIILRFIFVFWGNKFVIAHSRLVLVYSVLIWYKYKSYIYIVLPYSSIRLGVHGQPKLLILGHWVFSVEHSLSRDGWLSGLAIVLKILLGCIRVCWWTRSRCASCCNFRFLTWCFPLPSPSCWVLYCGAVLSCIFPYVCWGCYNSSTW